jgi:tetratricopeptide (TPR) repeat protein
MIDKSAITKAAQAYVTKGQIDKAITEWEKLIEESPDGNTYNTLGDLYMKKRSKTEAVEAFTKAADIFREAGFFLKAIALYKKILHISPLEVDALIHLGELNAEKGLIGNANENFSAAAEVYLKESLYDEALRIYEKMIEFSPSHSAFKEKAAELCLKLGLKEEAAKKYLSIASDYLEKKQNENARGLYRKAIECDANNISAFIGISRIDEEEGNTEQSYKTLNEAVSFAYDNCEFLSNYARLAIATGNIDNAKQALTKLVELEPKNNLYRKHLGCLYLNEGLHEKAWEELRPYIDEALSHEQWDESLDLLKNLKEADPVEVKRRIIDVYKGMKDNDSAVKELKSLANICEVKDQTQDALQMCREIVELDPSDKDTLERIKGFEGKLGIEGLSQEISAGEKSAEEIVLESDKHVRDGRFSEAAALLEGLIGRAPENMAVRIRLKDAYIKAGEKEKAFDECLTIARIYSRNGDTEGKNSVIAEAIGLKPEDPRLAEMSGAEEIEVSTMEEAVEPAEETDENLEELMAEADFYAQQGLQDEAVALYEKLISSCPDNEEIREKLSSLKPAEEKTDEKEEEQAVADEETRVEGELKDIFHEFKKGIDKELGEKDSESRYNLGIAYKEMGLIDDAIKEFKIAANDPENALKSPSMLALCYMEKKFFPLAIKEFEKVAKLVSPDDEGFLGAKCDLADACVKNKEYTRALDIYMEIYEMNPKFRDVESKVKIIDSMISEEKKKGKPKQKKDRVSYI